MNMRACLQDHFLYFDGAMGTMLQRRGLSPGALPELLNLTDPDIVTGIHRAYVAAGSDIVSTNTFQAHELKLGGHSVEEVVAAGVRCARGAGAKLVALDCGPLGQLLEPMGTLSFERAYGVYRRTMRAGAEAGADLILIETVSDLYEAKAAVLAAKENTALPVFTTMTFQEDGRTFAGCDARTAALTLQSLGVDALGVNCSLGPAQLMPVVEEMLQYASVPVIVQANAGLPQMGKDGQTVYNILPEEYAAQVAEMARRGVRILGGCCGTTPEYIRALKTALAGMRPLKTTPRTVSACTCGTGTVILDGRVTEIGERLNPTGKKRMQTALRAGDMGFLAGEAIAQVRAGAQLLDVNAGLPDIDEPAVLARAVREIQSVAGVPLQIDSADPAAIEAALRVCNGRPIVNSVNGTRESMDAIFPLAKKYGALVIGLTLDESGIPPTAEGRLAIARRILAAALAHGLGAQDLIVDCLVLTASAQQAQVPETLRAIRLVKAELGLKTVLGVSNVSFGLPQRELLNATFLAAALGAGLDAAIINPLSARYREVLDAFRVLNNEDRESVCFIKKYTEDIQPPQPAAGRSAPALREIIEQGRKDKSAQVVRALLSTMPPLEIIDGEFIPALDAVGRRFEAGEIFLPQLMQSAQAVQNGFAVIREHMLATGQTRGARGKILLATVQGDIHDIGKNIVRMLLENYGYEIVDLGKDVPVETVVEAVRAQDIRLAGLSALMTTTVRSMKDTIAAVKAAGLNCVFFVGGAVLNEEYRAFVGADYYARDAMESVAVANRFFGN